jgi:hypothetical protein
MCRTRLRSSYYNAPVDVHIERCDHQGDNVYQRVVTLSVGGIQFCEARSVVVLHSSACIDAVSNKVRSGLSRCACQSMRHLHQCIVLAQCLKAQ